MCSSDLALSLSAARSRGGKLAPLVKALLLAMLCAPMAARAQQAAPAAEAGSPLIDAEARAWFPRTLQPYRAKTLPAGDPANSASLTDNLKDGKLDLSVADLYRLLIENNLDFAGARYNLLMADTDLLRAKIGRAHV